MNYKKIIKICLFAFILQCFLFSVALATNVNFKPSITIPGTYEKGETITVKSDFSTLTDYIASFYKFAIGLTGILAVIMVTAGGMVWLTAGGSATQIGKAKQMIMGSIAGLLLALFSYTLLYSINPDIVNMKIEGVKKVLRITKGCGWQINECPPSPITEDMTGDKPSPCGQKPQKDGKDNLDYQYCCCLEKLSDDPDIKAYQLCIKELGADAMLVFGGSTIGIMTPAQAREICNDACINHKGLAKSAVITVKNEGQACCLCVGFYEEDNNNSISCPNGNSDCAAVNQNSNTRYTCWEDNYTCKPCKKTGDYSCTESYQCCSGNCLFLSGARQCR